MQYVWRRKKEVAALYAVIEFLAIGALTMHKNISGLITSVVRIQSLQMGVFGSIVVIVGVAALHNRFIELPQVLSFFCVTRFVPIISVITYLVVGIAMF
ncbi:hypothetical protein AN640_01365 [Candidatus Epulonipiscium fishelsonii]|uniref:Uncharacterized protein n=1 Tax=Candidatus Epulonipiscium fishelsonii TaxID=77094 RepID=A0ACC8XBX4_9FIRM|nr:hypothetical protein AN640_01365 [Epulopiscium sp. SCG-D08WGA-EpuloA1]